MFQLQKITFLDTSQSAEWKVLDCIDSTCSECEVIGWVVKETDTEVITASAKSMDMVFTLFFTIPTVAITKRENINEH